MKNTDAAWLAGFIDGEGSVMVTRSTKPGQPFPFYDGAVSVTNTSKKLIDHCASLAGGYISVLKKNTENPKWKNAYVWRVRGGHVAGLLKTLMPFLVEKREQAELVLKLKSKMTVGSKPGRCGTRITDEERAERVEIWQAVKALNHRGIKVAVPE